MVSRYNAKDMSFDFQSLEDVGEPWDNVSTGESDFAAYRADGCAYPGFRLFSD
jgi:hypothetical protein